MRRGGRWRVGLGLGLSLLAVVSVACTVTAQTEGNDPVGEGPVVWDLRSTTSAADLEGSLGREAILSTPGRNGVELRLVLPDGEMVELPWADALAVEGGNGRILKVSLGAMAESDPGAWDSRIDGFIERFGGDRAEIDGWLDAAVTAVAGGETVSRRSFAGQPRSGYQPKLSIGLGGSGASTAVVVDWRFDLTA